eukprot:gnl/TRDRNA2_/TRDRNA2_173475_c0_seq8.p3 gnl/TRDRNA2_/TRDRNA2_173475_c0~~gnl/TRDRNA2_/TRDRNA2_173475_c0_seq8.p3  ORF type:complete len:115 (-),score=15.28 gnl/TRDRNA2_/TRDRNA2_173475_c0_seq8:636-980(-)
MDARRDPVLKHFMKCLTTELRSYTTVERKVRFIAAAIAAACGGNPSANQADAADYEVGAKKKNKEGAGTGREVEDGTWQVASLLPRRNLGRSISHRSVSYPTEQVHRYLFRHAQ